MKQFQQIVWGVVISQTICISVNANSLDYWDFDVEQNRLEIVTQDDIRPKAEMISNPTRLIIDLPGVQLEQPSIRQGDISGYVREVRVGQVTAYTTRIVVELGPQYSMRPWEVRVRSLAPNRWFVQLAKFQPLGVYSLPSEEEPVAIAVPVSTPTPGGNSRYTVVIDAGHGGQDPGAVGLSGLEEKGVVLSIASEVAKILKKRGIGVIMTRSGDSFVSLASRVQQANQVNANVFISIHANAVGGNNSQVNGLETYYYSSGYRLALAIHRSLLRQVRVTENRGVRQARFYVLRRTEMPSALVEVGFVTGNIDNRNLSSVSYRQKLADAIADGITEYLR
ncbi:N-acetylmuramoyl-L-alanine amidase [Aphanothece sacrum]|uniref:N-acetylmuramoyl-L-alanine amidase n=1 Tax=Aphanothece sacrum FPU1 TaxID=1920663 RepID=A0A401INE0_APHSA|nr:N-acetylmuramoyl-L-alanine amidase [Aphanothece sacrum]GBF82784.1 N-acetylmuramoyl-L-alanine amidase [Aphanothece sacrum FPU1]GBF85807.1 N-acetylmuramoyl-L-alanine amidase [Aphanothece sacrum FPU3]